MGHLKSTLAPTDPHEHSTCCRFHFKLLQNSSKGGKKRTSAKLLYSPLPGPARILSEQCAAA